MSEFEERRIYERFKVKCAGYIKKDDQAFSVKIMNLSGQGMAFRTDRIIDNGTMLTIDVQVKDGSDPVSIFGEVIRSDLIEDSTYEIALKLDIASWMKVSQILAK